MKKQHFLILTSTFCLLLNGCESPQVTRQNEMAEARALVAAQYGNRLSLAQEAYLTMQVFQRMEADRNENTRVSAEIISNGFNNAGRIISESSQHQSQYIQPIQYNVPTLSITPVPVQIVPQLPTYIPHYQVLTCSRFHPRATNSFYRDSAS